MEDRLTAQILDKGEVIMANRGLVTLELTRFEAGLLWSVLESAVAAGHRRLAAEEIQRLTEDPRFPWVFERLVQSVRSFDRRSGESDQEM